MELRDRVVLITGARRGIGLATAHAAAAVGATVILHARERDQAEQAARGVGTRAFPAWGDLTRAGEIQRMVDETGARFGRLDGLVNNAGLSVVKAATEFAEEDWDRMFDVNVKASFFVSVAALPHLRRAMAPAIVNISSLHADTAIPGRAAYAASKAAVSHLTRALAIEWAPYRIRVNAVAPGFVRTEQLAGLVEREGPNLERRTPLGRLADPRDIATSIVFLLSDAARHITGEVLRLDGGWVAFGGWEFPAHKS